MMAGAGKRTIGEFILGDGKSIEPVFQSPKYQWFIVDLGQLVPLLTTLIYSVLKQKMKITWSLGFSNYNNTGF